MSEQYIFGDVIRADTILRLLQSLDWLHSDEEA
jgi:hypothetical protein